MCSLSLSLVLFGPGLTGTHTCFSGMHVLGWFRCPDSQQLLWLHRIHPFIASHVSLFVMFESRLNWDSPTPFFLCSHVLSFFFFGPGLTGTHPNLFFLCSHVFSLSCFFGPCLTGTHPFFSGMHVLGWLRSSDSQQLLSFYRIHPFIASHVSFVCNVWVLA